MNRETFKALMAGVPAPVTVVTTFDEGKPRGATISSFASLSLDPPLVSFALAEQSTLLDHLRTSRRFRVHLLAHDQEDVAVRFATRDVDRFFGVDWMIDNDLPRIAKVARHFECALESEVPGGDHSLILGRVLNCWMSDKPPLIYLARTFGTHSRCVAAEDLIRATG